MQTTLIIALLPVIGMVIGAVLQYTFGRRLEATKQFGAQKAQAYSDFFRAVAGLAQTRTPEMLSLAADAKARICLYGSSNVVCRLHDLERTGAALANPAAQRVFVELLAAMRQDIDNKNWSITSRELLPILFGGGGEQVVALTDLTSPETRSPAL